MDRIAIKKDPFGQINNFATSIPTYRLYPFMGRFSNRSRQYPMSIFGFPSIMTLNPSLSLKNQILLL